MTPALLLLASSAWALEIESFPSYERVLAIAVRQDSALVSTAGGAYRLGLSSALPVELIAEASAPHPVSEGLPPVAGFPATAAAVHEGVRYAGTFGGGLRRLPSGVRVEGVPPVVTALASTPAGLLCGTDHGLYLVSGSSVARLGPRGLPDSNVSVLTTGGGALWVGHFDRGVSSYRDGSWRHWGLAEGLPSEWVDDLAFDGERLWGATEKGVFWIEGGRVRLPSTPELAKPAAALFVSSGTVYVAQAGKVVVYRRGRLWSLALPEKHPQRLWVDADAVWVAGLEGLYRLSKGKVRRYGTLDGTLPANWVTALAGWRGGVLVGTYDGGLAALGSQDAPVLAKAWVNLGALATDGSHVALGEMDGGLHLYAGGDWMRIGTAEGLPGQDVSAVLFDGDGLWVGTRSGLARLRSFGP